MNNTNNIKVKCMFDSKRYTNKPQGIEVAITQKRLEQTEITLSDLANALCNGASFRTAVLTTRKANSWTEQQLFAIDCDHNTTIQEKYDKAIELGIKPAFLYTSFRHSDIEHKFRIVFCCDEVITNIDKRDMLQATLMGIIGDADPVCFNRDRLFFGGKGKQPLYPDYNSTINADEIINKYWIDEYNCYLASKTAVNSKSNIKVDKPKKESKTNATTNNTNMINNNIEAIKTLNVALMQSLVGVQVLGDTAKEDILLSSITLNPDTLKFKCKNDLYNYINQIDLNEYLNLYDMFNCILPNHEDDTPSAHIYISNDGTPLYKCFGCGKARTIIGITEELAGCKRSEAIEFIKKVYRLELVEDDWTKQQKELLIDSANYLDTKEFKEQFPELNKLIRTRKLHIQQMLVHFTQYVNSDLQVSGKPLFSTNYETLMKICQIKNRNQISQSLTLFSLLNMLDKVELNKIPKAELDKVKAIAAQNGHKKLINFYSFSEYGVNQLNCSEDIAKQLKKDNISLKGISREYVLRTYGEQKANDVFPQYIKENAKGTSRKSNDNTQFIAEYILRTIDNQGYIKEKDIYVRDGKEIDKIKTQWKKSITEILEAYDLKRIRLNKDIKNKMGIQSEGYPFIIVKSFDVI